ncbi:DNA/RNA non-specific endonuclease [Marinobacterium stanieri]|uniref:Endonuclease G n=1 Tax=Marinobacterium stanieri TaxID=49186 RepID=A0A1N6XJK8_9GAMM|nr:DNA/RNA non-specific endonuclease [Marinobacterium stanieri]SIR02545.1 endonuclease G [Marinobacterium stanieri]
MDNHVKRIAQCLSLALVSTAANAVLVEKNGDRLYLQYDGFDVIQNCVTNAPDIVMTVIGKDVGNLDRSQADFFLDAGVPPNCQQTSDAYYPTGYHRGHLLGANMLDNSLAAFRSSFSMVNILPMRKELNTGAWYETELMTECIRETGPFVQIFAGPIWGGPHKNGRTAKDHNINVPSSYWKVMVQGEYQIAWIIPNSKAASRESLPSWEVTIDEVQQAAGFTLPIDLDLNRNYRPDTWYDTTMCERS